MSSEDKAASLKEREEWLRDRGVEIETPEDRRASAEVQQASDSLFQQLNGPSVEEGDAVKFVVIPQDTTKEIRTLLLPTSIVKNTAGDALPNFVKPSFADQRSIDVSLLKEQATKHFAGGDLKGVSETNLSAATMNAAVAQGSVETFPLVHPADTNGYTGVYIYLDEVGLLKKLPHNPRASQLAAACGYHPAPNFYGDVYVGRVQSKPVLNNVDFEAGVDTDLGATWVQRAVSENVAWQQTMNEVTGKSGQTQPAAIGTEGTVASEDKFSWTQDDDELEITVSSLVSSGSAISKASIKVTFLPRSVKVKYSGSEVVSIHLYSNIDVDGCTWTIDGNNLVITCEKANGGEMWPRIQSS